MRKRRFEDSPASRPTDRPRERPSATLPLSGTPPTDSGASSILARAFTLVELLTTVAIIGVLTSMLVTGVAAAKRRVAFTVCSNHLRQIGLSCTMYAGDHRDLLPPMVRREAGRLIRGNWAWDVPVGACDDLAAYGAPRGVLACPSLPELSADSAWNYSTDYRVIGFCLATRGSPGVRPTNTFYSLARTAPIESDDFRSPPALLRQVADPVAAILASDVLISRGGNPTRREQNEYSGIGGGYEIRGTTVEHRSAHLTGSQPKRANALFLDGHVESRPFEHAIPRTEREPTFWW